MTDYTMAADALKRMAVQYKNIVSVAEALEKLGSVENAAKEADAALAKARKDRDAFTAKTEAEMTTAKGELALAQAAADKVMAEAKQEAAEIKEKAKAAAEKKAESIVNAATSKAEKVLGDLETSKAAAEIEVVKLEGLVAEQSAQLISLTNENTELQAQHDKLEKALATLKAKFA